VKKNPMRMLQSRKNLSSLSQFTSRREVEANKLLVKNRWSIAERVLRKRFGSPKRPNMKNKFSKKNLLISRKSMFLKSTIIMEIMWYIRRKNLDIRLKMTKRKEKSHTMMIRKILKTF
jgi:hypothetical protein